MLLFQKTFLPSSSILFLKFYCHCCLMRSFHCEFVVAVVWENCMHVQNSQIFSKKKFDVNFSSWWDKVACTSSLSLLLPHWWCCIIFMGNADKINTQTGATTSLSVFVRQSFSSSLLLLLHPLAAERTDSNCIFMDPITPLLDPCVQLIFLCTLANMWEHSTIINMVFMQDWK